MDYDITALNTIQSVGAVTQLDGRARVDNSTSVRGTTTDATANQPEKQDEPNDANAKASATHLAEALAPYNVSLQFSRDNDTGAIVVKIFDSTSGEQLRQIPDAAALKLSSEFEKLQGRLFSRHA